MAKSLGVALVAAGVGLAIGVGIGFVLGDAPGTASPPNAASDADPSVSATTAPAPTAGASREPKTARSRTTERAETDQEASGALAAALDQLPKHLPMRGTGTLTGSVTTAEGKPVPGVEIAATAHTPKEWRPARFVPWAQEAPLEEKVRDLVRNERWMQASRLTATSGADGTFELTELAEGPYRVRATAEGYYISARNSPTAASAKPGDQLDFVANPYVEFELVVLLPDGTTAHEARVRLGTAGNSYGSTGWTAADPRVRYMPGRYVFSVQSLDERLSSPPIDLELKAGAPPDPITVRLVERPGIGGEVILQARHSQGWAQVYLVRVANDDVPPEQLLRQSAKQVSTHAHAGWKYSFIDLTPGTYLMGVSIDHGTHILSTGTVEIGDSFVQHDVEMPAPRRAEHVALRATDPDGVPTTIQQVAFYFRSEKHSGSRHAKPIAQGDGTYWVPRPEQKGLPADTTWDVAAFHPSFGWAESPFTPGPTATASVRFEKPSVPTVRIEGLEGSDARGFVAVGIGAPTTSSRRNRMRGHNVDPGLDGTARLPPTAPGEYDLTLYCKDSRGRTYGVARKRISLTSGSQSVSIVIPTLHTLTVLAPEGVSVREFSLAPSKREAGDVWMGTVNLETDANGRSVFQRIPPGEYRVHPQGASERLKWKDVTIPGETLVRF